MHLNHKFTIVGLKIDRHSSPSGTSSILAFHILQSEELSQILSNIVQEEGQSSSDRKYYKWGYVI